MATITTVTHGNFLNTPRRSYITTTTFNNSFYSYTTTTDPGTYVTTGVLGPVVGATAANCPARRVLRENGKKLYPSAHPGVTTYMVGVYDANSGLTGFIDPNDSTYQVYNNDKPNYIADGTNPVSGALDAGAPVVTTGSVTASTMTASTINLYKINLGATPEPTASVGEAELPGNRQQWAPNLNFVIVSTTAITTSSKVFLTYTGSGNGGQPFLQSTATGALGVSTNEIVAGTSFRIYSNNVIDRNTVNWLIIN